MKKQRIFSRVRHLARRVDPVRAALYQPEKERLYKCVSIGMNAFHAAAAAEAAQDLKTVETLLQRRAMLCGMQSDKEIYHRSFCGNISIPAEAQEGFYDGLSAHLKGLGYNPAFVDEYIDYLYDVSDLYSQGRENEIRELQERLIGDFKSGHKAYEQESSRLDKLSTLFYRAAFWNDMRLARRACRRIAQFTRPYISG